MTATDKALLDDLPANVQAPTLEVDISPTQADEFAATKAGLAGGANQGLGAKRAGRGDEDGKLLASQYALGRDPVARGGRQAQAGSPQGPQTASDRLSQHLV